MEPTQKILRFIAEKGMSDAEFSNRASMSKSFMSGLRNGTAKLTLLQAKRAAEAMGVGIDWLLDVAAGWPPSRKEEKIFLSESEKKILFLAKEVSGDDPEMEEARRRLLLKGYRLVEQPQPPPGKSYAEEKAAPPAPRKPGRNSG